MQTDEAHEIIQDKKRKNGKKVNKHKKCNGKKTNLEISNK